MEDEKTAPSSDFKTDLRQLTWPLLQPLWDKHAVVARKLSIGAEQLQKASSVEEYQQIGILIRDAWIEFAQKLCPPDFTPQQGQSSRSSYCKDMLEYVLTRWPSCPKALVKVSKEVIDLANVVQHKPTIDFSSAKWCLLTTLFAISLMLDLDSQHDRLADRRYYRCPNCGGLKLV